MQSLLARSISLTDSFVLRSHPPLSIKASRTTIQQKIRTISTVKMSIEKAKEVFFNAEQYAVVGAS